MLHFEFCRTNNNKGLKVSKKPFVKNKMVQTIGLSLKSCLDDCIKVVKWNSRILSKVLYLFSYFLFTELFFSQFSYSKLVLNWKFLHPQSKIAVLLGERKGLQTTHSDLIRRIKMLEYALRQERIKFHRLKFGCDPPTIDLTQSPDESGMGANEIAAGM